MKVTPIMGEVFHFQVESRSRPNHHHFANWLTVTCTCEQWAYKNREHLERTGKNYVCAHLQAAKDSCWEEIVEHTKEQLLTQ